MKKERCVINRIDKEVCMSTRQAFVRIKSLSQLCDIFGYDKPTHPLITVVDLSQWKPVADNFAGKRFTTDLYTITG